MKEDEGGRGPVIENPSINEPQCRTLCDKIISNDSAHWGVSRKDGSPSFPSQWKAQDLMLGGGRGNVISGGGAVRSLGFQNIPYK